VEGPPGAGSLGAHFGLLRLPGAGVGASPLSFPSGTFPPPGMPLVYPQTSGVDAKNLMLGPAGASGAMSGQVSAPGLEAAAGGALGDQGRTLPVPGNSGGGVPAPDGSAGSSRGGLGSRWCRTLRLLLPLACRGRCGLCWLLPRPSRVARSE